MVPAHVSCGNPFSCEAKTVFSFGLEFRESGGADGGAVVWFQSLDLSEEEALESVDGALRIAVSKPHW